MRNGLGDDKKGTVLECVANISEGLNLAVLQELSRTVGPSLLDIHTDAEHHRSVFTMVGTEAPRRLARHAVDTLTIQGHKGVHPRLGVVDVVPFVALEGSGYEDALLARNEFAAWAADELHVPCFFLWARAHFARHSQECLEVTRPRCRARLTAPQCRRDVCWGA